MKRIDIRKVKVGGEIGRRVKITARNNMLVVDRDRDFLSPFRKKDMDGGYIGLGKFIDAMTHAAAYLNDSDLVAEKNRVVDETLRMQEEDGYLGILRPDLRFKIPWDIHEMAYLIHGLTADYRLWKRDDSLTAARRLADYLIGCWRANPESVPDEYIMTTLGLESALLSLYEQTQDRRYLAFCTDTRKLQEWDIPVVLGRWGRIIGHAYDCLSRCLSQLQLYRWQPDSRLLLASRRVLDFMLKQDGMAITGEVGEHECWHDSQDGTAYMGETCATAYVIWLLDAMLALTDDSLYGDIMERVIFNGLFAAQSPDGRKIRYYTALDGPRSYFNVDTYCCPNNYRRIVSELPGMVFYTTADGVAINLYTPSTAQIELPNGVPLTLHQQTDYPRCGHVQLRLDPAESVRFALKLRIPRWCEGAKVTINRTPVTDSPARGTFHKIDREWRPGDQVTLDLPMPLRLVQGRKAQAGRAAILRGPTVFCLAPSRHPDLAGKNLHYLIIDPDTLEEGPHDDTSVSPGGQTCRLKAWSDENVHPEAPAEHAWTLTEFPNPAGEIVYFKIPNPRDHRLVDDELIA